MGVLAHEIGIETDSTGRTPVPLPERIPRPPVRRGIRSPRSPRRLDYPSSSMATPSAPTRRVVITGIGAVTPCGNTATDTWAALIAGRSGIGRITRFDPTGCTAQIAGEVRDFDPSR